MKFFIDTANVEEIRKANDMGVICGVTTNPSLIAKEGRDYAETLKEIASIYKAKIIDLSPNSMVFELTGEPEKIDAFLSMLADYKIMEMCRTGITALERGNRSDHIQQQQQS